MWLKELQVEVNPSLSLETGCWTTLLLKKSTGGFALEREQNRLALSKQSTAAVHQGFFAVSHFSCVDRACQQAGERPDCTATAPEK